MWDLYQTETPLQMFHPAAPGIPIAVFLTECPGNGVVYWNIDSILAVNLPEGQPGSGLDFTPVAGELSFDSAKNAWILISDGRQYSFYEADKKMLVVWEQYKRYMPSIEQLEQSALSQCRSI